MHSSWAVPALVAAVSLGLTGAEAGGQPSRLLVSSYPDGMEHTQFRLSATAAGVRIAGTVSLPAGRDTILVTPAYLDLDPGATATLDASGTGGVTLLILPDSIGTRKATRAWGPRVRVARSAAGAYSLVEAREGQQVDLRVF